jgi:hypothetical protein
VADEGIPSGEELRAAFEKIRVGDVLVNALMAAVSLGFRHVAGETRDLAQAKLAIEALRALDPVLREGDVEDAVVRDLEQARANLQLAYAKALSERPSQEQQAPTQEQPAPPEEERWQRADENAG